MNIIQCMLTTLVGVYAIYIGLINLSPNFDTEMHVHHKEMFGHLNRVFPLYQFTNYRPYARNYRCAVGVSQILTGTTLVTGQPAMKRLAGIILLVVQLTMLRSEYQVQQYFKFVKLDMISVGILLVLLAFVLKSCGGSSGEGCCLTNCRTRISKRDRSRSTGRSRSRGASTSSQHRENYEQTQFNGDDVEEDEEE